MQKLTSKSIIDYLKIKKKYKDVADGYKECLNDVKKLNQQLDEQDGKLRQDRAEISKLRDTVNMQKAKIADFTKTEAELSFYRSSMQSIKMDEASAGL